MTRRELLERSLAQPVPQGIGELNASDDVWVLHVEFGATAHRSTDRASAVCGAQVLQWPVAAGQVQTLCGRLCSHCWPVNKDLRLTDSRGREEV